ncbi:DUF6122 family protein [Abyssalbus ytuae]|uniref:DUF6122 family protein n=1 Tax=Abyssalbus ytuae TaxID=2926907 RepID=A0A9E7D1C1_9FLAO|nr:DUF6122 family protein [Abyssalbus ytuae]UOB16913.1 DUF6122 family protein [Abyssalbus ytuae]
MLRFLLHYGIHFILPFIIAGVFFKKDFLKALIILLGAIIIDIDHLPATPVFDSHRCSINFHLLHTYPFIAIYIALLFFKKTRLFGIALLNHIVADSIDCIMI